MADSNPIISIIVGSASDADTIASCRSVLQDLGISHEAKVLSAHRTPKELLEYVEPLEQRGVKIVICAAGMAAHLAGVVAAHTPLPVIGIPVASGSLQGIDALLSTSQMPPGVPVACMGIGKAGARNAAFFAARMLALHSDGVRDRLQSAVTTMRNKVLNSSLPEVPK
jgi:phosphoribosylaminoimidazole carboxylase PurE protein